RGRGWHVGPDRRACAWARGWPPRVAASPALPGTSCLVAFFWWTFLQPMVASFVRRDRLSRGFGQRVQPRTHGSGIIQCVMRLGGAARTDDHADAAVRVGVPERVLVSQVVAQHPRRASTKRRIV